ncbi:MAG: 23S rRNA (adenine(2503)-C(2))-methyltransferase RlmN [Actinomycetota bacterium]
MTATRYGVGREELASLLAEAGEPAYRARQVWEGLHAGLLAPAEMTSLPRALRERIELALPPALDLVAESVSDRGGTVKSLWALGPADGPRAPAAPGHAPDGPRIESVLMHYAERTTECVSTQAGCAMACGFCATGQAGFNRQLTTGEIVEQVVRAARHAKQRQQRVANIVFMGMGEPLANEPAVWAAIERLHDDIGISARHLTVSTVGIIPGIRTLATRPLPVNLAVSMHAARDDLRDDLVPINKRYPIKDLMDACRDYLRVKNRRISFEWALIAGVNDTARDANELAKLALSLKPTAHVNIIPLNPTPGFPTRGTDAAGVRRFADRLRDRGVNATVRRNRGTDIDAACGQLAAGQPVVLTARRNV